MTAARSITVGVAVRPGVRRRTAKLHVLRHRGPSHSTGHCPDRSVDRHRAARPRRRALPHAALGAAAEVDPRAVPRRPVPVRYEGAMGGGGVRGACVCRGGGAVAAPVGGRVGALRCRAAPPFGPAEGRPTGGAEGRSGGLGRWGGPEGPMTGARPAAAWPPAPHRRGRGSAPPCAHFLQPNDRTCAFGGGGSEEGLQAKGGRGAHTHIHTHRPQHRAPPPPPPQKVHRYVPPSTPSLRLNAPPPPNPTWTLVPS